jgi:acyl-coenzyme A synthetase/AMP-(fatty) acid ligase
VVFDLKPEKDIYWCTADVRWITATLMWSMDR